MKRLLEMEIALSSPWAEEARKAHDEIERLTTVLDAARKAMNSGNPLDDVELRFAIRAYDEGEP